MEYSSIRELNDRELALVSGGDTATVPHPYYGPIFLWFVPVYPPVSLPHEDTHAGR